MNDVSDTLEAIRRVELEMARELLEKEGVEADYSAPLLQSDAAAARLYELEADLEAARLMALQAAWMADNGVTEFWEIGAGKALSGMIRHIAKEAETRAIGAPADVAEAVASRG